MSDSIRYRQFTINFDNKDYLFYYDTVYHKLRMNGELIDISDDNCEDLDEEMLSLLREEHHGKPYAKTKIALFNAPYADDIDDMSVTELIDYCILSIMGQIPHSVDGKAIMINRAHSVSVRGKPNVSYQLPTTGTEAAVFDYLDFISKL